MGGTSRRLWRKALMPTASQKIKCYGIDMHHQGRNSTLGALQIPMEEMEWDPAAARPDRCDGRGAGHFCGALPVMGRSALVWLRVWSWVRVGS